MRLVALAFIASVQALRLPARLVATRVVDYLWYQKMKKLCAGFLLCALLQLQQHGVLAIDNGLGVSYLAWFQRNYQ